MSMDAKDLQDKILPQQYRSIDFEENNFLKRNKSRENLSKLLLIVLAAASMLFYVIGLYNNTKMIYPWGNTALMVLIAGLSSTTIILIFIIICLCSKTKRLNNSNHLYFIKKEPLKYKIVENFSDSSVSVKDAVTTQEEEVDEQGNPIYYAEEVYDDEEDIFITEAQSTLLKKEKEITYSQIVESFNESLQSFGISGDIGINLLASMAFSKLIDVTNVKDVIPTLFKVLDNPSYIVHYDENESITAQRVLFNAFEYAKTHPSVPIFMMIDEIPAKEYLNYLRPLYKYIDDLNGDYYITVNGTAMHIPHNLYFLSCLKENDIVFDVSRRYLRYISILKSDYQIGRPEGETKVFSLTNEQLHNARRNAMENFSVEESTYKKLDLLFNMANEANGYVLQNKIQRKIEDYSSLLLSLEVPEEDVIDRCLSNNIIAAVVISSEPQKLSGDYNLTTLLDNEFGQDRMKLTKGMIKEYLSLFNAKGERRND